MGLFDKLFARKTGYSVQHVSDDSPAQAQGLDPLSGDGAASGFGTQGSDAAMNIKPLGDRVLIEPVEEDEASQGPATDDALMTSEPASPPNEVYDYPGGYAQRFDAVDKGGGEAPASDKSSSWMRVGQVHAGGGEGGDSASGEYYVTQVSHSAGIGADAPRDDSIDEHSDFGPTPTNNLGPESESGEWEHQYEFRTGKVAQTDYNFETPSKDLDGEAADDHAQDRKVGPREHVAAAGPRSDGELVQAVSDTPEDGSVAPDNGGDTLTHEVGHWLGDSEVPAIKGEITALEPSYDEAEQDEDSLLVAQHESASLTPLAEDTSLAEMAGDADLEDDELLDEL